MDPSREGSIYKMVVANPILNTPKNNKTFSLWRNVEILQTLHPNLISLQKKITLPKLLQFKWPLALPTLRESMLLAPYLAQLHQGRRGWTNRSVPVAPVRANKTRWFGGTFQTKKKLHGVGTSARGMKKGFCTTIFSIGMHVCPQQLAGAAASFATCGGHMGCYLLSSWFLHFVDVTRKCGAQKTRAQRFRTRCRIMTGLFWPKTQVLNPCFCHSKCSFQLPCNAECELALDPSGEPI